METGVLQRYVPVARSCGPLAFGAVIGIGGSESTAAASCGDEPTIATFLPVRVVVAVPVEVYWPYGATVCLSLVEVGATAGRIDLLGGGNAVTPFVYILHTQHAGGLLMMQRIGGSLATPSAKGTLV